MGGFGGMGGRLVALVRGAGRLLRQPGDAPPELVAVDEEPPALLEIGIEPGEVGGGGAALGGERGGRRVGGLGERLAVDGE